MVRDILISNGVSTVFIQTVLNSVILELKVYSNQFLIGEFGSRTHVLLLNCIENDYAEIGIEGLPSSYLGKIKVYIENYKKEQFFTNYTDRTMNFVRTGFVKTDLLLKSTDILLSNGDLCIKFEIEYIEELDKYKAHNMDTYKFQALDRLETLLDNQEFSDIKFVLNNKTIYANKLILVSGSSVFSAMFKHQMKEARENVIKITDIPYEVLMETLRFIYAGKVNEIEKYAKELLAAADMYNLEGLKEMCTIHLCKSMSVDNAIDYLHSADLHNAQELRNKAIEFIIRNGKIIAKRPDFNSLSRLHGDVVLEVVRSALSQERI